MNAAFLSQLRDKAQQRIKTNMIAQVEESDKQLHAIGDEITKKCGCRAIYGKPKSEERMLQKVQADYKGDWYDLKDAVRMTIVTKTNNQLALVADEIRRQCRGHRGLGLMKDEEFSDRPGNKNGLTVCAVLSAIISQSILID